MLLDYNSYSKWLLFKKIMFLNQESKKSNFKGLITVALECFCKRDLNGYLCNIYKLN